MDWISVEAQLPPKDKRVLVWLWEKGEIDIDILRREGKSDGGGLQLIKNYLHNITFWMPLPAPPDTKEPHMMIPQLETDESWQCPFCGDWFTDGETRCGDCNYSPDVVEEE